MKTIPLTRGYSAIVDDADFLEVGDLKWYAHGDERHGVYAARWSVSADGKRLRVFLHKSLMGTLTRMVDHRNINTLDCRRDNLRFTTFQQNACNKPRPPGEHSSSFRGVTQRRITKRWVAQISFNGRRLGLGTFDSELAAAHAYDTEARRLHGEFASLNFP